MKCRYHAAAVIVLLTFFILNSVVYDVSGADSSPGNLYALSAVLMDGDSGRVLYEKEGETPRPNARDLARIMRYAIQNPMFLKITQTREYSFSDIQKKRTFSIHNTNAFLDMREGIVSGKTGYTGDAGYCYVCAEERDGKTFIVALLGSGWPDHKTYKWKDASALLTYGEKNYNYRSWWEDPEIPLIRVKNGFREDPTKRVQYIRGISDVDTEQKESQMLLADDERIVCRMNVPEMLEAPVKRRDKIGRVTFLLDGQILTSYPVLAEQSIERRTFFRVLEYVSEKFFH